MRAFYWLLLLCVAVGLLGCGMENGLGRDVATEAELGLLRRTQTQQLPRRCQVSSEAQTSYVHVEAGFCLRYPSNYQVVLGGERQLVLQAPMVRDEAGEFMGEGVTVAITRLETETSLAAWASRYGAVGELDSERAMVMVGDYRAQGWYHVAGEVVAGYEEGEREVDYLVVSGEGGLYQIAIAYDGESLVDLKGDAQAVGRTISNSFTPLSWGFLRYYQDCQPSKVDYWSYVNVYDGYCVLIPRGMAVNVNQTLRMVSVTQVDGERLGSSMTFHVGGETDGDVAEVVSTYLADVTPSWLPVIERMDGSLDGEPMILLQNVPGPARAEQLFVVRQGRVYALAMMPHQVDNVTEALEVWEIILDSWRFVNVLEVTK
ncbi:MAG TPA: hypothetical protein VLL52_14695 [Anaerolineae bacterium]|nr:hypothetical protein [Anaerolineae bacterium]